jgi:hypothetical protein
MRATHRSLLAGILALVASLALATGAWAVAQGNTYQGKSKHKHYGLTVYTQCNSAGCQNATEATIKVTEGSKAHPHASCAYNNLQMTAKLKNGKSFSAKKTFTKKHVTLSVSGTFASGKVKGKVTGPKACGGADDFALNVQPNGGY